MNPYPINPEQGIHNGQEIGVKRGLVRDVPAQPAFLEDREGLEMIGLGIHHQEVGKGGLMKLKKVSARQQGPGQKD